MKKEELNRKQVILRMILGSQLILNIKSKNGGWLEIPNKGRIRVSYEIAAGLVGGKYLDRVNEDDGSDEFKYTTNIHITHIKKMKKLSKEELHAFVMYVWKSDIEPATPTFSFAYNPIEMWVRSIKREFDKWLPDRLFYLKIVKTLIDL